MDDKELIEALKAVEDTATETRRHARAHIVKLAAARLTALAEEVATYRKVMRGICDPHFGIPQDGCPVCRCTALAEENERLRQLLWSSREMLECAEYKDAENAQVALFVREQIEKLSEVPR